MDSLLDPLHIPDGARRFGFSDQRARNEKRPRL
jgi:hypothetical protein